MILTRRDPNEKVPECIRYLRVRIVEGPFDLGPTCPKSLSFRPTGGPSVNPNREGRKDDSYRLRPVGQTCLLSSDPNEVLAEVTRDKRRKGNPLHHPDHLVLFCVSTPSFCQGCTCRLLLNGGPGTTT